MVVAQSGRNGMGWLYQGGVKYGTLPLYITPLDIYLSHPIIGPTTNKHTQSTNSTTMLHPSVEMALFFNFVYVESCSHLWSCLTAICMKMRMQSHTTYYCMWTVEPTLNLSHHL